MDDHGVRDGEQERDEDRLDPDLAEARLEHHGDDDEGGREHRRGAGEVQPRERPARDDDAEHGRELNGDGQADEGGLDGVGHRPRSSART